jgi:hypothetical protein
MADTLMRSEWLRERDGYARIAVWAHNARLGDARATDSACRAEWNVGQFCASGTPVSRSTSVYHAQRDGDGEYGVWSARDGKAGQTGAGRQLRGAIPRKFTVTMLPRAIGVQYLPETERQSHYFDARLGDSSTPSYTSTKLRP